MFADQEAQAFLDALDAPETVNADTLLRTIVAPNVGAEFGRAHGFDAIRTVDDYRRAVPIHSYEDLRARIDRVVERGEQGVLTTEPVKRFFATSGSTAKPKFIPVTNAFAREKSRAFGVYWSLALAQHPGVTRSTIVTNFSDSGDAEKTPGGLPVSSESAYWSMMTAATQQRAKPMVPKLVAKTKDNDARYYAIARVLAEEQPSGLMTLNPSTIWLLFQKMNTHRDTLLADVERGGISPDVPVSAEARALLAQAFPGNPARAEALRAVLRGDEPRLRASDVWPSLRVVVSWRSPMLKPYLDLLAPHLEGVAGRDYISMASEGILAIPTRPGQPGGALAMGVHFYELIPEADAEQAQPRTILPHEAELGQRYVVVLSTQSGLYRYNIGDVVEVVGFERRTPIVSFQYRAGNTCSLTGEKLTEDQVTSAIDAATKGLGLPLTSFTVTPAESGFPRYVVMVELGDAAVPAPTLAALGRAFERELEARNIEYGSKRKSERLGAPEVWLVAPGEYARRRQARVAAGTNDAQYKPVHLTRSPAIQRELTIVTRVATDEGG